MVVVTFTSTVPLPPGNVQIIFRALEKIIGQLLSPTVTTSFADVPLSADTKLIPYTLRFDPPPDGPRRGNTPFTIILVVDASMGE